VSFASILKGMSDFLAKRLIPCVLAFTLLPGCSRGAQLIVINQSDVPLPDVVVSGSGFSQQVGTIAPHTRQQLSIRPRGESGLQIRFNASGNPISFGPDGYFEVSGGYLVTATVSPKFSVSVKSELVAY
jgi:hypothetical protein